jgi:Co/Zn/Cd efflux system component
VRLSALLANKGLLCSLWRYRSDDSNMHSAWICTRNDVLCNCAVPVAAVGVFETTAGCPALIVATIRAAIGLQGATALVRGARPLNSWGVH